MWMHIFCLLFLCALLEFILLQRHVGVPQQCHYPLNMQFTPTCTHTGEGCKVHQAARSGPVTVRATLPKCNEKNRLDCVFLSPVKIQKAVLNF